MKRSQLWLVIFVLSVLLVKTLLHVPTVEASWQPFNFATPISSQSGSISTTTLFTAPSTSYYVVCAYMSPSTAVLASTATLTIGFTEGGVARTITASTLSLTSVSPAMSNYLMIRADAGTAITYTVTAVGTATYNVHLGWKPQGS